MRRLIMLLLLSGQLVTAMDGLEEVDLEDGNILNTVFQDDDVVNITQETNDGTQKAVIEISNLFLETDRNSREWLRCYDASGRHIHSLRFENNALLKDGEFLVILPMQNPLSLPQVAITTLERLGYTVPNTIIHDRRVTMAQRVSATAVAAATSAASSAVTAAYITSYKVTRVTNKLYNWYYGPSEPTTSATTNLSDDDWHDIKPSPNEKKE